MNELGNCFIFWGPSPKKNLGGHNGRPWEWEDVVLKSKRLARGKSNWTWAGWRKLEWSLLGVLDSTRRRGGKNWWGNSLSFSPHILYCLQTCSLVQKNLYKGLLIYIGRRSLHSFLLQFSLCLKNNFIFCTLNLYSCRTCKSFHEGHLNTLPQWNL